ncbi:hypothetical protein NBCG_02390 [Nocardioidaceae bacterium Broad-1]|nr:hypothetical protein NBCG_02390 [Nocardioidaceae bacterium Broad-1]
MLLCLGTGLIFGAGMGSETVVDAVSVHGRARESAQVVSVKENDGGCAGLKQISDSYDIRWRSLDGPEARPLLFETTDGCRQYRAGDVVEVVRVYDESGAVEVHVDPPASAAEAVLVGLLGGAVGAFGMGVLVLAVAAVSFLGQRQRGRRVRRHGSAV